MKPKASVIISSYNQPEWLEKVLWGYEAQRTKDFEMIIADDGSGEATGALISKFIEASPLNIKHVWQEDHGFQKTKILNKAILKTSTNYLIFTDGDCIPRNDFVEKHLRLRKKGCYLSGAYFKLPMHISKNISKEDIVSQTCFSAKWLQDKGMKKTFKMNKLSAKGYKAWFLNTFTPTKATWDGNNASGWKADILAVNGFDERMQYGGEDTEMGERMVHYGIIPIQLRYSIICLHLEHKRGYVTNEMTVKNERIRKNTQRKRCAYTPYGIEKINR